MKDELAEIRGVAKGLEDWAIQLASQIDLTPRAVTEAQPQDKVSDVSCFKQPRHALLQRRYGPQELLRPSAFPILLQFGHVRLPPLLHVTERTMRQAAPEHGSVSNAHRSLVLAVAGMEMGWIVIVEEHTDHDPEERLTSGTRPL